MASFLPPTHVLEALRVSWWRIEASLGVLSGIRGRLEVVSGGSWVSWGILGAYWDVLGAHPDVLGAVLGAGVF